MSDIFISYERNDLERIKPLAMALESQGWSVFYDLTILPGINWRKKIVQEINECKCMIVGWSKTSINSRWVPQEADMGLNRGILVPFLFDQVIPPLGHGDFQTANLIDWQGDQQSIDFILLCQAITKVIDQENKRRKNVPEYTQKQGDTKQLEKNDDQTIQNRLSGTKTKNQFNKPVTKAMGAIIAVSVFFIVGPIQEKINSKFVSDSTNKDSSKGSENRKLEQIDLKQIDLIGINKFSVKEPEMVIIPAGTFKMGSRDRETEKDIHSVTIKKPFAMGKYPVTFDEYDDYVEKTDLYKPESKWGRGKQPVIRVSWDDAVAYAEWLSMQTGKQYRLPTEAEWEYAARAGTETEFFWEDPNINGNIKDYAWYHGNSDGKAHLVGGKLPNQFGLYDMSGNVWEWVQDCKHKNYKGAPEDGTAWEHANGGDCSRHLLRGGSLVQRFDTFTFSQPYSKIR